MPETIGSTGRIESPGSRQEIFGFFPMTFGSFRQETVEVTGKNMKISGQEYCFCDIPGNPRNRPLPCRILRPGQYSQKQ